MKVCEMNRSVEGHTEQDSLTGHDVKEKAVGQKSDYDVSDARNALIGGRMYGYSTTVTYNYALDLCFAKTQMLAEMSGTIHNT